MKKKTKTETLSFKVCGEGLTTLVRDIYLYEDQAKAWNIMGTLHGLSIDQATAVFEGRGKFITDPDDDSLLCFVDEVDEEWQREYAEHKAHLKDVAKEEEEDKEITLVAMDLQSTHDELSLEEAKDFVLRAKQNNKNSTRPLVKLAKELMVKTKMAELRKEEDAIGDDLLERMTKEANMTLAKSIFINNFAEKDPDKKKAGDELVKSLTNKQYSFIFKGKEYTYKDSARNQGRCPHCDEQAPDHHFWQTKDSAYVGMHSFGNGFFAACFECPACFEKFYYHKTQEDVDLDEQHEKRIAQLKKGEKND